MKQRVSDDVFYGWGVKNGNGRKELAISCSAHFKFMRHINKDFSFLNSA